MPLNGRRVIQRILMPTKIHEDLRQTDCLLRKHSQVSRWKFPEGCEHREVSGDDEILDRISMKGRNVKRTLLIVDESDFLKTVTLLRNHCEKDVEFHFGIVVIASDPADFIRKRGAFSELLHVVTPKSFSGMEEAILLRTVRHMVKLEELGKPRAGQKTLLKLNEIFIALSAERDPKQLLATILLQAMDMTNAEGGTLYMIEEQDGEINFRLRISKGIKEEVIFYHTSERVMENSICGYVALTGKTVNVKDVTNLRPYQLPVFSPELDHNEGPVSTLITVPLQNRQNEIIAVLELVNKRNPEEGSEIPPERFTEEDESLLSSFGTQAAICLENVDLFKRERAMCVVISDWLQKLRHNSSVFDER